VRQIPQNPAQGARLADAKIELKNRLQANNGDNPCARLFGGVTNALKKLDESIITFRSMGGPISRDGITLEQDPPLTDAITLKRSIAINSDGRFMAIDGAIPLMGRPGMAVAGVNYYRLGDIESAAFILAHELGHRTGKLENDGNDDKDQMGAEGRNNERVRKACFKDSYR
jgi:hypothetical protein